MKIVIVDYGMGNIRSIINALNFLGEMNITVSSHASEILAADKLILPGVGNFATAISQIKVANIDIALMEAVHIMKKPILGICLGMQLMCSSSTESGINKGLCFVDANVTEFDRNIKKVPHVGVNQVIPIANSRLFSGLGESPDFYFTHSFKMLSSVDIGQSICNYYGQFIAAFEKDNCAGVQFHPELSQTNGLMLLENFIGAF